MWCHDVCASHSIPHMFSSISLKPVTPSPPPRHATCECAIRLLPAQGPCTFESIRMHMHMYMCRSDSRGQPRMQPRCLGVAGAPK